MENLDETSYQYCKEILQKSKSNFYYSFLFLSNEQQQAITIFYAFCRTIDDVVDSEIAIEISQKKIDFYKKQISAIFCSKPSHPIAIALVPVVRKYQIQESELQEIILGMEMDLKYQGYETFLDLELYCYRVASLVGVISAKIFGVTEISTISYAKELGHSFQIINIIRDIGEDARRGRIYLPKEHLAKYKIQEREILNLTVKENKNYIPMMDELYEMAYNFYNKALSKLQIKDLKKQKSGLIMAEIYFGLLEEIRTSEYDVMNQKIHLTPLRKIYLAIKANFRVRKELKRSIVNHNV